MTIGHQIRIGTVTAEGRGEVVLGLGFMLIGQNSYGVSRALQERLETVKQSLPAEVEVTTVYNRSTLVEQVIGTVRGNLSEGALLVVAIVFFFLRNLRAGLIVALAIPLSMLLAFSGMAADGHRRHAAQPGGDRLWHRRRQSIVVVENIIEHLRGRSA